MVTTIRLPDELHGKLKAEAERKGMTFNAYVISVLWAICKCGRKGKIIHNRKSGNNIKQFM